jgi:predicted amidohydrolase
MPRIVVAVGQLCSGASLAANLAAVESLAARAAARGARMLFLPEGTALMCSPAPPPAEPLSGALVASYAAVARRHGLCLSLCVPEAAPPGAPPGAPPYNTHIVLSAAGALLAAYRKVHLFDAPFLGLVESARAAAGAQLVAVDVLGARLGLATCYDLRFPELYRTHAERGACILTVPAAFTVPTGRAHWEVLLRARGSMRGPPPARGLDFPAVDWVVQLDAPEDPAMYVHRVGRTARYNANGRALLFLLPTEEQAVSEALTKAGVPIKRLTINSNKTVSVASRAADLCRLPLPRRARSVRVVSRTRHRRVHFVRISAHARGGPFRQARAASARPRATAPARRQRQCNSLRVERPRGATKRPSGCLSA